METNPTWPVKTGIRALFFSFLFMLFAFTSNAQHHHNWHQDDSIEGQITSWFDSLPIQTHHGGGIGDTTVHGHHGHHGGVNDSLIEAWHDSLFNYANGFGFDTTLFGGGNGGHDTTGGNQHDSIPQGGGGIVDTTFQGGGHHGHDTTGGNWNDSIPQGGGGIVDTTWQGGGNVGPDSTGGVSMDSIPNCGGGIDTTGMGGPNGGPDTTGHTFHMMQVGNQNTTVATASVYPNPMVESATIQINNTGGSVTFKMVDLSGKIAVVKTGVTNGNMQLNRGDLNAGVYIYQIMDGNNIVSSGKIVLQ